jgi:hypothetical protein
LTAFRALCYFEFAAPEGGTASPLKSALLVLAATRSRVITGFNTDIQHGGVTYHVQTEDKGLETPLILSLVYVGGAIIASKRTPYEDLLATGFDEKVLTERLNRQHKLICAAIRAGRVADLKRMGGPASPAEPDGTEGRAVSVKTRTQRKKKSDAEQAATESAREVSENGVGIAGEDGTRRDTSVEQPAAGASNVNDAAPTAEAKGAAGETSAAEETPAPVVPGAAVEAGFPVEAGAPVEAADGGAAREDVFEGSTPSNGAGKGRADEIVILTTLVDEIAALGGVTSYQPPTFKSEPLEPLPLHEEIPVAQKPVAPPPPATPQPVEQPAPPTPDTTDELYLTLLDDEGDFRAGQLVMVKVHVGRGTYGQRPVASAQVTVKVLGTTFRPLILTSATDATGVAVLRAMLPRFTSGRAAIIIRAVDGEDAAEMRRIIHQA